MCVIWYDYICHDIKSLFFYEEALKNYISRKLSKLLIFIILFISFEYLKRYVRFNLGHEELVVKLLKSLNRTLNLFGVGGVEVDVGKGAVGR